MYRYFIIFFLVPFMRKNGENDHITRKEIHVMLIHCIGTSLIG